MWRRLLQVSTVLMVSLAGLTMAQEVVIQRHRAPADEDGKALKGVEIRRTTDGIPHLRATHWRELGVGIGHVQAQDALCTLADGFVTYQGRRSWFFGPEARPPHDSMLGRPKNLDLDFFFRAFADAEVLKQYRAQLPADLNQVIDGYAAGYNRYLLEARRSPARGKARACLNAAWVQEISADDVYRRMYAAQIAAGYGPLVSQIVSAQPGATKVAEAGDLLDLKNRITHPIGQREGVGSNVLAFGKQVTGEGAVLLGNPHWYWGGPDRFYQMHLTIPGQLNVAGVGFLGVPIVLLGFNEQVAWSHTVSAARRFGLFDLTLDKSDPTRVVVDGQSEALEARNVSVDVRDAHGAPQSLSRTFYRSRFGPLINLSGYDAAFGWGTEHAVAIRDVNAQNFRIFRNFFYWNQAKSLDDFMAIQRREVAIPWINTAAIGRGDGRVWYADMGAVPNVPDALRGECATPLSQGFGNFDPVTPFLDGSRSACDWRPDGRAVQSGAMSAEDMPWLLREDYVANMNDSYWLTTPLQPLEGFPAVLGGERQALSLRSRQGHRIAQSLSRGPGRSSESVAERLMVAALSAGALSAELFKTELLGQACAQSWVALPVPAAAGAAQDPNTPNIVSTRQVNVSQACTVLKRWSGRMDAHESGLLLWEAFWTKLEAAAGPSLYRVAFSPEAPLNTPRSAGGASDEVVSQALAAAVVTLGEKGVPVDAALGSQRYVRTEGRRVPLFGGCLNIGYFATACSNMEDKDEVLGPNALGNSYLQVVRFGAQGVVAHTLLAHGQEESAVDNGAGAAPVKRYARKAWLAFPFSEAEIARDPELRRTVLLP